MPVKLRLQRKGRKKKAYYHIVAADSRAPRDGRFIEQIGSYNPLTVPATIELDRDRALEWLEKGAQPTHTVNAMLKMQGVLYRKHLNRGVAKGAISQEEADKKYNEFISAKDEKNRKRAEQARQQKIEEDLKKAGLDSGTLAAIAASQKPQEKKAEEEE
ncbi:MAG: 30S ribosomal protein S16 [Saprospirales bacterium]|nr:MAG: 30S ribosomal protein S16 [Saprospirales bacterium]